MATLTDLSARDLIVEAIEGRNGAGDLDTLAVAVEVVEQLGPDATRKLAVKGAREMVGEVLRSSRISRSAPSNRSIYTEKIHEQRDRLATFFTPIPIGDGVRHVLDCSPDDVREVVDYYRQVQEGARVSEGKWTELLKLAEAKGAEVMRDLGEDEVRRIFDV